jgi:glycosyltransferase involved in cell wall biosynthesis
VVDDCSRIPVAQVLGQTGRLEIIRLETNLGPAGARNVGLQRVLAGNHRYVAILDADDVTYPERFAKQIAFLDANSQVAAVGTWERFIDDQTGETVFYHQPPCSPGDVRKRMFFNCALAHSAVMIRADAFAEMGSYDPEYPAAEDYETLRRIATKYDLANLPECLVDYRVSREGISVTRRRRQLFDRLRIQLKYFAPLNWRAWAGAANTLLLFLVPRTLVTAVKKLRG